jgi:hypothetical protein
MRQYILFLISIVFFTVSCQQRPESKNTSEGIPYEVSIDITSPGEDELALQGEFMHLHVVFSHLYNEPIQHVKVELLDSRGEVAESLFEETVAEPSGIYTYHYMGYMPAETGEFTLRAVTSDQDQEHEQSVTRTFRVK